MLSLFLLLLCSPLRAQDDPVEATWAGPMQVRRCLSAPLPLPVNMDQALNAVLIIEVGDGVGSGVLVSPDGYVVTAAHVVAGTQPVRASQMNGQEFNARRLRVDELHDVALLLLDELEDEDWPCLPQAVEPTPLGTELFAVGSPGGRDLSHSVSKGIVSGKREWEEYRFIQTDAALSPGNSGGPLLDPAGRVIGVVSWKIAAPGFEGLSFGVPVEAVGDFLDLAWSDVSESDPPAFAGRRDIPETPRSGSGTVSGGHVDLATPKGLGWMAGGAALAGAGSLTALITWGVYAADPDITRAGWGRLQVVNTCGWGGLAAGGLMMGGGLLAMQKSHLHVGFVPGGLLVGGAF